MPTLAEVYENHAEECLRAAAKADDPKQRALMLKLASAWREDAEALKRGQELQPASAKGKSIEARCGRHAERGTCTYPAAAYGLNGVRCGRIVRAAGAAKEHERINFFFVRAHQEDTTVAACKFDGRIGHLRL